jgi:predicted RecB family endonuclease
MALLRNLRPAPRPVDPARAADGAALNRLYFAARDAGMSPTVAARHANETMRAMTVARHLAPLNDKEV